MTAAAYVVGVPLALVGLQRLWVTTRAYLKWRGRRVITCPETQGPAAVDVAARHAALAASLGKTRLELSHCSLWPEREGCGQACLAQIESAPEGCLARNILTRWYERKSCAFCRKAFGEIEWHDHKPALLGPDGITVEWSEIAAERIPEVLATHRPVCWNCHIVESFRRKFPELVTDRPPRPRPHA